MGKSHEGGETNTKSGTHPVTMWTAQTKRVLDTLERDGIYYVKDRYITEKYGETAWIFKEAYHFFTKSAGNIVEKPEAAESPVWMFRDKRWAVPSNGMYRLELRIPAEELIIFDMRLWSRILNLSYIGTAEQEKGFEEKWKRTGIKDPLDIFRRPYYPLLKAEIIKSWERLFSEGCQEQQYEQGAAWLIKREWM